jgi:proteasome accessory factor C
MSATADDRLGRLLALVPWLTARPGVRVALAAEHFGVTETQLRRDLDLLFLCGLPPYGYLELIDIDIEPGPDGDTISIVAAQGLDRPLRLTGGEAVALRVAARALADVPGLERNDALERALKKIEQATAEVEGTPVALDLGGLDADAGILSTVRGALDARTSLRIRYRNDTRDEVTDRVVDPLTLHLRDGRFYLEAWCHRAEAIRLFRLDRIELAEDTGEAATADRDRSRSSDSGVFTRSEQDLRLVLDLEPEVRWVADYYPVDSVEYPPSAVESRAGGLRVTLRLGSDDFARRLLLRLGPAARVVEPARLATAVRDTARAALAAYAVGADRPNTDTTP